MPRTRAIAQTAVIAAFAIAMLALLTTKRSSPPIPPAPGVLVSPMAIALYLWMALSVYWELAARKVSKAVSEESGASRTLHLVLVSVAQVLLFWPFTGWPAQTALTFEFPRVLPAWPFLPPFGLALTFAGFVFAAWARRKLGRHWSGAVTTKVDHELITSGPYRHVRHPIYTGVLAMYAGTALISGRLQGLIAVVLVALAYARKVRLEEETLRQVFGEAYDAYRRRSSALVPGIY